MPETASLGTLQVAETPQLPQSTKPVALWLVHEGCNWGSTASGWTVATLRAPLPP